MSTLIEESDVTPVNLAVELERAVIEHSLDESGQIYVTEDNWYPFWIHVKQEAGFVLLKTHTQFRRSATPLQRLELCNAINKSSYLVTASSQKDRLYMDHALSFRDGLLRETLVRVCRNFAKSVETTLDAADPDGHLVLSPGTTEPADESADNPEDSDQ